MICIYLNPGFESGLRKSKVNILTITLLCHFVFFIMKENLLPAPVSGVAGKVQVVKVNGSTTLFRVSFCGRP